MADKLDCRIEEVPPLKVLVANGSEVGLQSGMQGIPMAYAWATIHRQPLPRALRDLAHGFGSTMARHIRLYFVEFW